MYRAMRKHFGHQHWWPGDGALEICVGAILTQNTHWANVERAIANLKAARCLSVRKLHAQPQAALARLIRPAGYFNVKARRLKNFIADVVGQAGGSIKRYLDRPVAELRQRLLAVSGIGPETADSIILYAAGKPSFVVDTYTHRILSRHGLADAACNYPAIQAMFEQALPRRVALWNDYHAQLVATGKHFCRPKAACDGCPLRRFGHNPSE